MKLKTNLISLLIGAALATTTILSIAAAPSETQSCGRFQLIVTDYYLYKIDTTTGQIWRTEVNNPSKAFMAPNIGSTNAPASRTGKTNDPAPSLEKN